MPYLSPFAYPVTVLKREEEARKEGQRAGCRGKPLENCPYVYMTAFWVYWTWGWHEGREGLFVDEASRDYEFAR